MKKLFCSIILIVSCIVAMAQKPLIGISTGYSASENTASVRYTYVDAVINAGGEAGEADVWGDRRLAYSINKKNTGYYVVIPFKAEADLPKELDRRLRINENVMRHIIVCQDEE